MTSVPPCVHAPRVPLPCSHTGLELHPTGAAREIFRHDPSSRPHPGNFPPLPTPFHTLSTWLSSAHLLSTRFKHNITPHTHIHVDTRGTSSRDDTRDNGLQSRAYPQCLFSLPQYTQRRRSERARTRTRAPRLPPRAAMHRTRCIPLVCLNWIRNVVDAGHCGPKRSC